MTEPLDLERDAEIARLRLQPEDFLRCLITKNECGTDTWAVGYPCRCDSCQRWLRLRATRADAMERSSRVWYTEIDGKPQSPGWTITAYARAIEQAQREATEAERRRCATIDHIDIDLIRREAHAAAIEEAVQVIFDVRDKPGRSSDWCNACNTAQTRIRALAEKPGSET